MCSSQNSRSERATIWNSRRAEADSGTEMEKKKQLDRTSHQGATEIVRLDNDGRRKTGVDTG